MAGPYLTFGGPPSAPVSSLGGAGGGGGTGNALACADVLSRGWRTSGTTLRGLTPCYTPLCGSSACLTCCLGARLHCPASSDPFLGFPWTRSLVHHVRSLLVSKWHPRWQTPLDSRNWAEVPSICALYPIVPTVCCPKQSGVGRSRPSLGTDWPGKFCWHLWHSQPAQYTRCQTRRMGVAGHCKRNDTGDMDPLKALIALAAEATTVEPTPRGHGVV